MLKIVGLSVVALLIAGAGVLAIGWLLPVAHQASRAETFHEVGPDALFELISAVESYPSWWHDVSRVESLPPLAAEKRFRQHDANGTIVMAVVESQPPHRFVTRIDDPDQPFGGTWTFEIVPDGLGARLTITERGEVYSPLFRFMSRFIFGHTATMESFLAALAARTSA